MSFDLLVYSPRLLTSTELLALIDASPDLQAVPDDPSFVRVTRGADRSYCFTVDGPDTVEPEDLPAEVVSTVLGARYLWEIRVEAPSSQAGIPYAVKFARKMARELSGAVLDGQSDDIWSPRSLRKARRPAGDEIVDIVELDWYCLAERSTPGSIEIFVESARQCFPEAMPRRFGEDEPLQGKYDDSGTTGLVDAWQRSESDLFFLGTAPVTGGEFGSPTSVTGRQIWHIGIEVLAAPLNEGSWRDGLRRMFAAVADGLPAVYATAQVTRGWIWSGNAVWDGPDTEQTRLPMGAEWLGLVPYPVWWEWFGPAYQDLVSGILPEHGTSHTTAGVLHERAPIPLGRDRLAELVDDWRPAELLARIAPDAGGGHLERAVHIPEGLREARA